MAKRAELQASIANVAAGTRKLVSAQGVRAARFWWWDEGPAIATLTQILKTTGRNTAERAEIVCRE